MSEQAAAEAAPDVQPSDGPAEAGGIELGKTTSEVAEQQPEPQPEQTETADSQDADGQGEEKAGAPESYTFEAPEGLTVSESAIAAYSDFAKSLDLPQDQAQDGFSKLVAAQHAATHEAHQQQVAAWEAETRKDPQIGGDNFDAATLKADQTLAAFDKEGEFTALLNQTGLAAHPAVRRALVAVRDAIGDDRFVAGNGGESRKRTARDFYQNSNMNP